MQSSEHSVSAPLNSGQQVAVPVSETDTHAIEVPTEEALEHIHLPPPTIWPITTAFGVTLGFMGFLTSYVISYIGILIAAWGVISWIQELRHEHH